jgi:dipeptidyl aminopeptidase/acylaminoacyl peptidase
MPRCRPFLNRLLAVLSLTFLFASGAAPQDSLSIEDLMSLKSVAAVRMNPAGDRIAYLLTVPRKLYVDDDGRPYHELHVVDFDGRSQAFVTGNIDITRIAWTADGEAILFLAKREKDAEFNSLYRIPVTGGEAEKLFTHVNNIIEIYPAPDGKTLAFLATDSPPARKDELEKKGFKAIVYEESEPAIHVWMLDLATATASRQALPGSAHDVAWAADGKRYAVALAPTPLIDDGFLRQDIHVVDARSGRVINAIGSTGKLGEFAFSPDCERIAYIGSVDIHDPSPGRLYVASATGGERRELVPNYFGHVQDFVWVDDVSVRWLGARGVWTETANASIMTAGEAGPAPTSGPIVRAVHSTNANAVLAAIADTPEHPREVFLLRGNRAPERLTDSNPFLHERKLARQQVIRYTARDGLLQEAILIQPPKQDRDGNPLVMFVHGGPEAHQSNGWLSGYSQPGQVLAAKGYAVVYPNYRGSTGRGVEFSMLGQHASAEAEFDDLVDVKRHLVTAGIARPDKTGISGASYGGYASMWAASALTEEFQAAVAFVGIANHISMLSTGDIPNEMYNVHVRAWPWDDWMWMLERSPIYHAGRTRTPLLIMGGDKDPRVHPSHSLEMYRMVKLRTDTPVRLVIYPGEVHGNRNSAAQYDYALRLVRWMDHYLQGSGGDAPPYELDHAGKLNVADGS